MAQSNTHRDRGKKHLSPNRPLTGGKNLHERRRRYIPHGHCEHDDTKWKPHPPAIEPKYTNYGPDWFSRLRYIPAPMCPDQKNEDLWPDGSTKLRTFPGSNSSSVVEWTYYTNGFNTGKRCFFDKIHQRSNYGGNEISDKDCMGSRRKEYEIDKRNGIWNAAKGDRDFQAVEYSPGFFKHGATIAPVNFGDHFVHEGDTFIPLTPLPAIPVEPYHKKEMRRKNAEVLQDVVKLESWTPATPLQDTLKPNMFQNLRKRV